MNPLNGIRTKSRTSLGRRGFLQASGGLVVAFSLFGDAEALSTMQPIGSVQGPPPEGKLYAWLAVHQDNTVTLFTGKVDVGTGTKTALAQIAAEELDISVDRLAVVMGNTSETVDQGPSYGSRTVRYAGPQIRQAAAAGRAVLLDLAADHFKTKAGSLSVKVA